MVLRIAFAANSSKKVAFFAAFQEWCAESKQAECTRLPLECINTEGECEVRQPDGTLAAVPVPDVILHKLYEALDKVTTDALQHYLAVHPQVVVVDSFDAVAAVNTRMKIQRLVDETGVWTCPPTQLWESRAHPIPQGVSFPIILKSDAACGLSSNHSMAVCLNETDLLGVTDKSDVVFPCVLQRLVPHGGLVYKVYVVGSFHFVALRKSLGDVPECAVFSSHDKQMFGDHEGDATSLVLPAEQLEAFIGALRRRLPLTIFGFDVIARPRADGGNEYFVVDINYFPGLKGIADVPQRILDAVLEKVSSV